MRLKYLARDRTAALRQYDRCVTALDEELGVQPAAQTVALYNQMRVDQLGELLLVPNETVPATPALMPGVLAHLEQLQMVLSDVQGQVQKDIQSIEAFIKEER
jgi:hypothetical protein